MKNDETPDAVRLQLRTALDKCLAEQGMKTQEKTNDMNRIVKAVFCGQDRRRVSAYAKALLAAAQENVTVEELPDWITTNGGIEKVRLGTKAPGPAGLATIAKDYLTDNVLFTVEPNADAALFGVDDEDKPILLFATYRATGEIEINSVVKHDSSIATAAYAAYYAANKKKLTAAKQSAALFN
ncbi:MAG: hypothetical protein GZ092_12945 [Polaromonas sp.]|nr:hypothetical protein [Polaromonas sp.]